MAKITNIISESNFEAVRTRISTILALELANQKVLTEDTDFDAVVWNERFVAFDNIELPAVNVFFNNFIFTKKEPTNSVGEAKYSIEILVNSKNTATYRGDVDSSLRLQKLMRVIRYILDSPHYITLDFARGFILRTNVESMRVIPSTNNVDSTYTTSAQIIFNVGLSESNGTSVAIDGEKYTSSVELNESEKGFYFEVNN